MLLSARGPTISSSDLKGPLIAARRSILERILPCNRYWNAYCLAIGLYCQGPVPDVSYTDIAQTKFTKCLRQQYAAKDSIFTDALHFASHLNTVQEAANYERPTQDRSTKRSAQGSGRAAGLQKNLAKC